MKRLVSSAIFIAASAIACAQIPVETRIQLAQKDVEIAQLKMQLLNTQAFSSLVQTPDYIKAKQDMNRAQSELAEAQKESTSKHEQPKAALPLKEKK